MKVKQVEASSASDIVVKQILANIEAGDLKPGDRLPTQEKLGEMFGVGRSSIREAANALAIMGYLEITQGRGTFIKRRDPGSTGKDSSARMFGDRVNLFNLLEVREVLECHAVEQAAVRADEHQLSALKRAVQQLEDCRQNVGNFLAADLEFHLALASAGNNPELGEVVRHIHNATNARLPVAFTTSRIQNIGKAIDTAQKIYTHILKGETRQAQRCLRNHLAISREALENETMPTAGVLD